MNQKATAGTAPAASSPAGWTGILCSGIVAPADDPLRRTDWLRRVVGLFGLLLIGVTWQLWTPQTVYPQVPLVELFRAAPAVLQWGVLAGQVLGLLLAVAASHKSGLWRFALLWFAGFTLLAALVDQHRLQPWAYQFAVMGIALAFCPPSRAVVLLRVLTVSIYFYSAVSKFDYVFLHTVGQQFLAALLKFVHVDAQELSETTRLGLALLFPIGELLVALGLCWKRTRLVALCAAIAMHVMLFLAVGPWGLGHKPGVLVWNLFFIAQNLLLFTNRWPAGPANKGELESATHDAPRSGARFAKWLVVVVVALPLLEPWGRFDHWLAWGLYAPKSGRAQVYVHRSASGRLSESLRRHLPAGEPDSPWLRLRIDNWSLAELDVPIYPQDRFQLGVAEAVGQRYGLNRLLRVVLLTPADRFTGQREATTLEGVQEITAARDKYWLNTHPGLRYVRQKSSPAE